MKGAQSWGGNGWGGAPGGKGMKGMMQQMQGMMNMMGGKGGKGGGDEKGKGKGKAAQKVAMGEKPSSGQVRSFLAEKSCGFIANCLDAEGQDVYAYKDVLENGGAGPGDIVAFFIHWSAQGKPQASHPLCRIGCPEGSGQFALKGWFKPGPTHPEGHGFIICDETKEFFGRDVYVNKTLAPTLTKDQVLAFNCHLNADGMPNVSEAQVVDDSWAPTPGDLSQSGTAEITIKGKGKGKDKGGKGGNMWGMMPPMMQQMMGMMGKGWGGGKGDMKGGKSSGKPPPSTGESYVGLVKSFNAQKNYGFIECEDTNAKYGCDVFTHGSQLADKEIGAMVSFEVGLNKEGKPQGLNVQIADGSGGPPAKKQKTGWEGGDDAWYPGGWEG